MKKNIMPIAMDELENVTGGTEPMIIEQRVTYYDANGREYTITVKARESKLPDIIAQKVTYYDASGHEYTTEG